jgi:Rrf2 family protein
MLLSKSCVYAIRAALLVSYKVNREDRNYIPVKELSKELNISFHFLTKILQKLTEADLMQSFRGPHGGVALAQSPDSVTLLNIVHAIDGENIFEQCLLGLPDCNDNHPCPLHNQWKEKTKQLEHIFRNSNLDNLAKNLEEFTLSGI